MLCCAANFGAKLGERPTTTPLRTSTLYLSLTFLRFIHIMILVTTASIALWYAAWSVLTLERNYRRAKTMGIPLIRVLVDPLNIPWQVIEPHFWAVVDYFDISLPKTTILLRRGWHFQVKSAMHEELGPIWAFVTPKDIHVQVCDSEALHDIYARRADFLRPREFYRKSSGDEKKMHTQLTHCRATCCLRPVCFDCDACGMGSAEENCGSPLHEREHHSGCVERINSPN